MDWNEDNNNDLLDLIKKYSEEISNLKKQNEVLLNTINNQNINSKKNNNMINYKILNNNESLIKQKNPGLFPDLLFFIHSRIME